MPDAHDAALIDRQPTPAGRPVFDAFAYEFDLFTAVSDRLDRRFSDWLTDALSTAGPRHTAVELGCGAGRHTIRIADHVDKVTAVDISPAMLDLASRDRSAPNIDYQHRDALSVTPATDGLFDLVVSIHTNHKLSPDRPTTALEHVRSLVGPGGILITADITDPGTWTTDRFHIERAFGHARAAYQQTSDRRDALTILGLLLHPAWLDMVKRDTPPTRQQFHQTYTATFPGAVITDFDDLMSGAVWHRPGTETTTDQP